MIHPTPVSKISGQPSDAGQQYEAFLQQLSAKGRATMERHDERADEGDGIRGDGELWKRLAGVLGKLAGHATEVFGQQSVKFYIADGKYKLQVFTLHDTLQGTVVVYLPDVLKLALKKNIVSPGLAPHDYKVKGCDEVLHLEPINAQTKDLTLCKAMVGWGREALRADLGVNADERQVAAVEKLARLAAEKWMEAGNGAVNP